MRLLYYQCLAQLVTGVGLGTEDTTLFSNMMRRLNLSSSAASSPIPPPLPPPAATSSAPHIIEQVSVLGKLLTLETRLMP